MKNPEQQARLTIDTALTACGWVVQDYEQMNLAAAQGVAVREFPLASGFGRADYALYVGEELVGAVEAKKEGVSFASFETQTQKYSDGVPDELEAPTGYAPLLTEIAALVEQARHRAAIAVNNAMTELYWNVGRLVVNHEQGGARRADYGAEVMERLATDLTARFGRGFSRRNLEQMRAFFLQRELGLKPQTASALLAAPKRALRKAQTASALSATGPTWQTPSAKFNEFPLPWSHYVARPQPDPSRAFV